SFRSTACFTIGRNIPVISEGDFDAAFAIAIRLLSKRVENGRPSLESPLIHIVHDWHIKMNCGGFWCSTPCRSTAGHQHGLAHPYLAVHTTFRSRTTAEGLLTSKYLRDEIDELSRLGYLEIRRYGVKSFSDWTCGGQCGRHCLLL